MTVQILSQSQKELVVHFYKDEHLPICTIAKGFNVSSRTIGRVLDEAGYCVIPPNIASVPYTEQTELELKFTQPTGFWQKLKVKIINFFTYGYYNITGIRGY